jgi:membrane-associated protein
MVEAKEIITLLESFYQTYGYAILFLGSFIETSPMGWTIPGGLIVALGGFFAYGEGISLYLTIVSAWLGMWATFLTAYFLGARTGGGLIKRFKQEKNAKRAKRLLENHGPSILTTSLMANLTRFWVAYVAGSQKFNFIRFLFYSAAASLTWTGFLVAVGYLAGAERGNIEAGLTRLGVLSWGLLLLALFFIYWHTRQEYEDFRGEEEEE